MKIRFPRCGCFAPPAVRDEDEDEFSGPVRRTKSSRSSTRVMQQNVSTDTEEATMVDLPPVSIQRFRSWVSDDFFDCVSEIGDIEETFPPALRQGNQLDDLTQGMLDAALAAQEALLFWHTGDGASQFKDAGKSGKVKLAIIPAKGDTMQVVKGTASFGVGELTLEEVVDFLTDVEKKGKYDSQFAQGHKKRALFEDPSTKRRLDLDYAAYKAQWGVSGRDCVLTSVVEKIGDDMWVMSSRSCEYPGYGEGEVLPGYVRCQIVNAGNVVERDPDTGEIFVTMYSQMSIGGNIPTWIVNKAQCDTSTAVTFSSRDGSAHGQNMLSIPDDDFMDCLSVVTSSNGETEVAALARQVSGQFDEMTQTLFVAARSAQAEILQYLTSEGASEFTSLGNAGAVEITARPPPGMMNVGGRDCVYAILREKIRDDLWIVSSKSVDLPEYPENGVLPGYVRCDVKFAGYAMSIDPKTKELTVTMYNQVDVKGNIPTWIVNKAQNKQPACLNDMYKLLKN
ncbi:hypothetical protein FOZ60_001960 [Perkinsus olseni]|uniref:START domain-containing protein n=2 Tax=Perkinsus olseni TaxID=32597 RepID=A0A7J6P0D1_PEROL|nr:hypothetical protein FOZ60_001960 [Perkinsus olseni]